jgi:hypothetical protein
MAARAPLAVYQVHQRVMEAEVEVHHKTRMDQELTEEEAVD